MGVSRCQVSFTDCDGIRHAVEVKADSLYEAVAIAVAEWRKDQFVANMPGPMTEIVVTVIRKPAEHRVRLGQVQKWAQPSAIGGPAGILRRERVRKLLALD